MKFTLQQSLIDFEILRLSYHKMLTSTLTKFWTSKMKTKEKSSFV